MGDCVLCDGDDDLPNRCKYCNRVFCTEHRLPEAHDCPGLDVDAAGSKHFESSFDDSVKQDSNQVDDEQPYEVVEPTTMGTTPDPDYEGSPDVNLDGSIASEDQHAGDTESEASLLRRLLAKLF